MRKRKIITCLDFVNDIFLQDVLEHAIISEQSGRALEDLPGMSLQQFPYPCSIDDRFILAISRTFPLFMTLSWIYSSAMIIKSIVYEKERRLKETMRVMGLGNGVHWVSWFIDSLVVMMFSSGMLSILLKVRQIQYTVIQIYTNQYIHISK